MERPVIYVKRITNLSDARYCAGMGADLLGFVASPGHEDYVSPELFSEIMGWVSGPKRVVELTDWPDEGIETILSNYHPDMIHLSGKAAATKSLPQFSLILEMEGNSNLQSNSNIEFVVVASADPGIKKSNEQQVKILVDLGKGEAPNSVLLQQAGVSGFMLQGSRELKPGLKDYDHLSRILEALDA